MKKIDYLSPTIEVIEIQIEDAILTGSDAGESGVEDYRSGVEWGIKF